MLNSKFYRNIKNFKVKNWKTTGSCFMKSQYITSIGLFYNNWGFYLDGVWLWRISGGLLGECLTCEELSGVGQCEWNT